MRTQDRGLFLLTLSIVVCLLSLFPLDKAYADNWNVFKCSGCSKSKCIAKPAIAADCFNNCPNHGGADCKATMDTVNAAVANKGSDPQYIHKLHTLFFAALKADGGGALQIDPNADSGTLTAAIQAEIANILTQWDAKYIRSTFTSVPPNIKNLVAECKLTPNDCATFKDKALARRQYCPPSTIKDCIKAYGKSTFADKDLKIALKPDVINSLTGGGGNTSGGSRNTSGGGGANDDDDDS